MKEKFEFGRTEFKFSIHMSPLFYHTFCIEWFYNHSMHETFLFAHPNITIPSYYCYLHQNYTISQDCHCLFFLNSIQNEGKTCQIYIVLSLFYDFSQKWNTSPRKRIKKTDFTYSKNSNSILHL
jgi:hypothetical protein